MTEKTPPTVADDVTNEPPTDPTDAEAVADTGEEPQPVDAGEPGSVPGGDTDDGGGSTRA